MTAFVIPNAILITTRQTKYSFASFLSRDTTFDVIYNIWRLVRPDIGGFLGLSTGGGPTPRVGAVSDSGVVEATTTGAGGPLGPAGSEEVQNKVTQCRCGRDGTEKHFSEIAMDTVIPGPPEKIHNLMFTSGFLKDFLVGNQQLRGRLSILFFLVNTKHHINQSSRCPIGLPTHHRTMPTSSSTALCPTLNHSAVKSALHKPNAKFGTKLSFVIFHSTCRH